MEVRINEHRGMANQVAKEKLPTWLYQKIHNLELSKKLGRMVKRGGYANVLTTAASNIAALNGMKEFTDNNGGRQILLQDGTGLEESVYSAGVYGVSSAIANDERTVGKTVNQMYPVLHENILRSGAGIVAGRTTDYPFWYGYINEIIRFPNATTPITIAAGKYLDHQFYNGKQDDLYRMNGFISEFQCGLITAGMDQGHYLLYFIPVVDGYQNLYPNNDFPISVVAKEITADRYSIKQILKVDNLLDDSSACKRITDIDVFVANPNNWPDSDKIYPAYFLERIPLDDDGETILEQAGTFEDTDPPTYIEFDVAVTSWETFNMQNFFINFTSGTEQNLRLNARSLVAGKARYTFHTALASALQGVTVTCKVYPRWYLDTNDYFYPIMYDDYYKKLGSEMYEYLGIPTGDMGLSDVRYKFSCIANKRYFIFGTPDGAFGYFSKANEPDIIPSQNILRLQKEPTGCVNVGRDVIAFYPSSSKRFTVLSEANAEEDDTFSNIGVVSQKAILNITDEEAYGFDLRGPWSLYLRTHRFIGSLLTEWWEDELSESEKNECVIGYNRLKDWVLYSFPTYTGTHDGQTYSNGIVFVFDRGYYLKSDRQIEPWWILKTDQKIYNWTVAEDDNLHLLTGSRTAIVDWNEPLRADQDESVKTLTHLKLLKNPILGNRVHFDMLYLYYVSDIDAMVGKIRADDGAWETLTINSDQQSFLRYICDTLEVELSTAASTNDVEISEEIITFTPMRL